MKNKLFIFFALGLMYSDSQAMMAAGENANVDQEAVDASSNQSVAGNQGAGGASEQSDDEEPLFGFMLDKNGKVDLTNPEAKKIVEAIFNRKVSSMEDSESKLILNNMFQESGIEQALQKLPTANRDIILNEARTQIGVKALRSNSPMFLVPGSQKVGAGQASLLPVQNVGAPAAASQNVGGSAQSAQDNPSVFSQESGQPIQGQPQLIKGRRGSADASDQEDPAAGADQASLLPDLMSLAPRNQDVGAPAAENQGVGAGQRPPNMINQDGTLNSDLTEVEINAVREAFLEQIKGPSRLEPGIKVQIQQLLEKKNKGDLESALKKIHYSRIHMLNETLSGKRLALAEEHRANNIRTLCKPTGIHNLENVLTKNFYIKNFSIMAKSINDASTQNSIMQDLEKGDVVPALVKITADQKKVLKSMVDKDIKSEVAEFQLEKSRMIQDQHNLKRPNKLKRFLGYAALTGGAALIADRFLNNGNVINAAGNAVGLGNDPAHNPYTLSFTNGTQINPMSDGQFVSILGPNNQTLSLYFNGKGPLYTPLDTSVMGANGKEATEIDIDGYSVKINKDNQEYAKALLSGTNEAQENLDTANTALTQANADVTTLGQSFSEATHLASVAFSKMSAGDAIPGSVKSIRLLLSKSRYDLDQFNDYKQELNNVVETVMKSFFDKNGISAVEEKTSYQNKINVVIKDVMDQISTVQFDGKSPYDTFQVDGKPEPLTEFKNEVDASKTALQANFIDMVQYKLDEFRVGKQLEAAKEGQKENVEKQKSAVDAYGRSINALAQSIPLLNELREKAGQEVSESQTAIDRLLKDANTKTLSFDSGDQNKVESGNAAEVKEMLTKKGIVRLTAAEETNLTSFMNKINTARTKVSEEEGKRDIVLKNLTAFDDLKDFYSKNQTEQLQIINSSAKYKDAAVKYSSKELEELSSGPNTATSALRSANDDAAQFVSQILKNYSPSVFSQDEMAKILTESQENALKIIESKGLTLNNSQKTELRKSKKSYTDRQKEYDSLKETSDKVGSIVAVQKPTLTQKVNNEWAKVTNWYYGKQDASSSSSNNGASSSSSNNGASSTEEKSDAWVNQVNEDLPQAEAGKPKTADQGPAAEKLQAEAGEPKTADQGPAAEKLQAEAGKPKTADQGPAAENSGTKPTPKEINADLKTLNATIDGSNQEIAQEKLGYIDLLKNKLGWGKSGGQTKETLANTTNGLNITNSTSNSSSYSDFFNANQTLIGGLGVGAGVVGAIAGIAAANKKYFDTPRAAASQWQEIKKGWEGVKQEAIEILINNAIADLYTKIKTRKDMTAFKVTPEDFKAVVLGMENTADFNFKNMFRSASYANGPQSDDDESTSSSTNVPEEIMSDVENVLERLKLYNGELTMDQISDIDAGGSFDSPLKAFIDSMINLANDDKLMLKKVAHLMIPDMRLSGMFQKDITPTQAMLFEVVMKKVLKETSEEAKSKNILRAVTVTL